MIFRLLRRLNAGLKNVKPIIRRQPKTTAALGLSATAATAAAVAAGSYVVHQKNQKIKGQCEFSAHTREQHQKHLLTGMHEPFISKDKELTDLFYQNFSSLTHLMPKDPKEFSERLALKTPVRIRPLSECPVPYQEEQGTTIAVGGPPALIGVASRLGIDKTVIYINDERRWPIANGSAWHIEEDADAEAPTTYSPYQFMKTQIGRALYKRESYEQIERTGQYPWRTLDWMGYLKNPGQWLASLRVAAAFQAKTAATPAQRQAELDGIAVQCRTNEVFYSQLNAKLDGKLFLSGMGGIIVARTEQEVTDLDTQKQNLFKEKRELRSLSKEELEKRGIPLQGLAFAEKTHDKVLSPSYKALLSNYIKQQGGQVIDATAKTIYADANKKGAVLHYQTPDGKDHYVFGRLMMSLGNQEIRNHNDKPLFDVIGATGSSGLAAVFTEPKVKLPRAAVLGGTNHVTTVSEAPIPVSYQGKPYMMNIIRFTAGACVTPAYRGKEGTFYDSTISLGLVNTLYQSYDSNCLVKPLTVYGCNRIVSQHGQTKWIQPFPGVHVQFGAGGGGLTRAPDFVAGTAMAATDLSTATAAVDSSTATAETNPAAATAAAIATAKVNPTTAANAMAAHAAVAPANAQALILSKQSTKAAVVTDSLKNAENLTPNRPSSRMSVRH